MRGSGRESGVVRERTASVVQYGIAPESTLTIWLRDGHTRNRYNDHSCRILWETIDATTGES